MAEKNVFYATGRRKTSTARVFLKEGAGKFTVNKKPLDEYFKIDKDKIMIAHPMTLTNTTGRYDINVTVKGGGTTGQADAIKLGISRALLLIDEDFRPALKKEGLLTRDSRKVERKKYGLHKARKSSQFSKR